MILSGIKLTGRMSAGLLNTIKEHWILTMNSAGSGSDVGFSTVTDSLGNIYFVGYSAGEGQGSNDIVVVKVSPLGAVIWQRTIGSSFSDVGVGIDIDSSNNIYVVGSSSGDPTYGNNIVLIKYNSSGTLQWQRSFGGTSSESAGRVAVDKANNWVYLSGLAVVGATGNNSIIAKYDTSGSLLWQAAIGTGAPANSIALDNSGYPTIIGYTSSQGQGGLDIFVATYSPTGALQTQRALGSLATDYGVSISANKLDTSGSKYICGYSNKSGNNDIVVAKYNTSNTLQWQRTLSSSFDDFGAGIANDSNGNSYIAAVTVLSGVTSGLIAKYNSSGVLQWQRTLSSTSTVNLIGINIDSSNIYVVGYYANTTNDFFLAKLPIDGSLTGTYGNFVYAASTLTDAAGTLVPTSTTLSSNTISAPSFASSLVSRVSTFVATLIGV